MVVSTCCALSADVCSVVVADCEDSEGLTDPLAEVESSRPKIWAVGTIKL